MDQEALVRELRKLRAGLAHRGGPIALLMLLASDQGSQAAWNLVVSAKGLDQRSRAQAVHELTNLLHKTTSRSTWDQIVRTTVLRTDDPFVRAFNAAFDTGIKKAAVNLVSTSVSGYDIPRALLLESHRTAA
jgi:Arc/MetJ family transcription regulator